MSATYFLVFGDEILCQGSRASCIRTYKSFPYPYEMKLIKVITESRIKKVSKKVKVI